MTKAEVLEKIRAMNIPGRVKCLAKAIFKFVRRHPGIEIFVLGIFFAGLLKNIPLIGHFVGWCILITASIAAMAKELKTVLRDD